MHEAGEPYAVVDLADADFLAGEDLAELIYLLKGRLIVNVEGEDLALDEGDAMYFDSGASHS